MLRVVFDDSEHEAPPRSAQEVRFILESYKVVQKLFGSEWLLLFELPVLRI